MTVLHLELTAFRDRDGQKRLVLRERGEATTYAGPHAEGRALTEVNKRLRQALWRPPQGGYVGAFERIADAVRRHPPLLDQPQSAPPQSFFDPGKFGPPGAMPPELDADVDGEAARDTDGQHDQEGGGLEVEAGAAAEAGVGEDGGLDAGLASDTHDSRQPFVPHGSEDGRESTRGEGA